MAGRLGTIGAAVRLLVSEHFVLVLAASWFGVTWLLEPKVATAGNVSDLVSSALPLLVVAVGQTVVLITGGIDLSVTATISIASVAGAAVMSKDEGLLAGSAIAVPAALLAMVLVGAVVGLVNGLAVARLRMPPFMVTLATGMFVAGLAVWSTGSDSIRDLPDGFIERIGHGSISFVPWTVVIAGAATLAVHVLLRSTVTGRWLYAVGHNARAARISGVPVERTTMVAYVTCGICAAVGSILYTARLETGSPVLGEPSILLDVVGAAVIGGTSLFGGRGKAVWTISGVVFITVVGNSLDMLDLQLAAVTIAKGAVILAAATLDTLRHRLVEAA